MSTHNFRKLAIWQNSMNLVRTSYKIIAQIQSDERFGLISQIARCSVSIPSNIAEGSGRSTDKDFAKFLGFSLGSCYELETQLILVYDLFNIDTERAIMDCQEVQKMIFGFQNKLNIN